MSQNNVIIDPVEPKIRAIIDWEYAGFFPPEFDTEFYKWRAPWITFNRESDDSKELLATLRSKKVAC